MIKIKKFVYFSIFALIINIIPFCFTAKTASAYTMSQAECVIELNSQRVIFSKNENEKLPMASTTKILTALTVIENFDLNKVIIVPKNATNIEGSSIYLREGEHLTIKELLYGLMLRSGNDCAECLALTCSNNKQEFIDLMNNTAKKYGATNSNFVNAHGLHDKNHYTTAYDLCLISLNAMKNPTFKEIVSTKKVEISNEGYSYKRVLVNKNKMLSTFNGCTGVKTGFTKNAGRCLVSSAERNGLNFVCVVINSPQMWERSQELLNTCFENYKMTQIVNVDDYNNNVYLTTDNKRLNLLMYKNFSYPIKNSEINDIKIKVNGKNFEDFIKNPKENGIFEVFLENKLIFSQNIFTIVSNK